MRKFKLIKEYPFSEKVGYICVNPIDDLSEHSEYWIEIFDKSPIHTTTDGVDIMEGDKLHLFLINKDLSIPYANEVTVNRFNNAEKEVADRYLTFTSEENRDKYIKENSKKVIFVSADRKEIFEGDRIYIVTENFKIHDNPCNKFDGSNEVYVYFSTKELAQEYIDNNKPKYSLADVFMASEKIPSGYLTTTGMLDQLKKLGK